MATMLPNIALFAELGQWGDAHPTLRGGCWRVQSYQGAGTELVDGDDGGCCMATMLPGIPLCAELGQWVDTQSTLIGGC